MSTSIRLPSDRLSALRIEDVQLYLASRGWRADATASGSKAMAFSLRDEPDAEVLLPRDRDVADYVSRLADAVQMLAVVENRSAWELLNDLSMPPSDVIRLQVTSPDATLGLLPLYEGLRLIGGGHAALRAAACSAHRPQSFYPRQSFKEADDFLASCRLGQTERGSYVATILAPVPPDIQQQRHLPGVEDLSFESEPYARRATLRFMSALGYMSKAIEAGSHDEILNGIDVGVSANLCEAVAGMKPEGDQARLQIRMAWSRSRPRVPPQVVEKVSFSQTAFSIISEVGRRLREDSTAKRRRIEGYVIGLKAETTLIDGFEGVATLRAVVDGSPVRILVSLNRENYAKACDAHKEARQVAVAGLLLREPKTYRFSEVQEFRVLSETGEDWVKDGL